MSGSSGMRALIRQASTPSVDAAARSTMLDVIVSQVGEVNDRKKQNWNKMQLTARES
jgi:hypothetical protein